MVDKILVIKQGSKYDQRGGVTLAWIGGVGVLLGGVLELGSGTVIYRKANTHVQYTIHAMLTYDDMTCSCI